MRFSRSFFCLNLLVVLHFEVRSVICFAGYQYLSTDFSRAIARNEYGKIRAAIQYFAVRLEMTVNTQFPNASFLCLALQLPASKLMLDVLKNLGIPFKNSLHDGYEEHQVIEIERGYLELYTQDKEDIYAMLAVESENVENSLAALPKGFKLIYKGETDLERYCIVAICEYFQGFQVKIYERAVEL